MTRQFFLAIVVALTLHSCSIQEVEMVRVNDINLSPTVLEKDKNPQLVVNVRLDNPNKFNIKVKKAKLKLDINGNDAGDIILVEKVLLAKKSEADYEFILEGEKAKIMKAVTASGINIALTGKVNVTLKGWIKGKAFGLGKKIDVNEKKSFSLKDLDLEFN